MELESLALLVGRSQNLPMLPQVASSIIRLADDPNSSTREMAIIIEQDPAISAKVLRVANSAAYGSRGVACLTTALNLLGMKTMQAMVIAIAYQQVISDKQSAKSFSKLDFWRHSLAAATGARILGKLIAPDEAEELYLTGLIHDVGMLVLDRFIPDDFDSAITLSCEQEIPLHEAETQTLGFNHAEVGALLVEKWELPPRMEGAIRYHHEPLTDNETFRTSSIIAAADTLSYQCGYPNNGTRSPKAINEDTFGNLELPPEQYDAIRSVIASEVEKAHEAFQIR